MTQRTGQVCRLFLSSGKRTTKASSWMPSASALRVDQIGWPRQRRRFPGRRLARLIQTMRFLTDADRSGAGHRYPRRILFGARRFFAMNDAGAIEETDTAPRTFNGALNVLPVALRLLSEKNQWVVWDWARGDSGKWTKPPLQAGFPHRRARNNDPATWSSHAEAAHAVQEGIGHGIGFVLTGTEIAAIDLDHCRDSETGAIDAWAQAIIDRASDAYIEVTVSGSGLRVVGTATGKVTHTRYKVPGHNGAGIELYRRAVRYITVSGLQIGNSDTLSNIDALIDSLASEHGNAKLADVATQADFDFGKRGINDLIRNGAPERQRSEAFQGVVWRLANCGYTVNEIERTLAAHPNGIAKKYEGRLRKEIERSYRKWKASGGIANASDPDAPDGHDDSTSHASVGTRFPHDWNDPDDLPA